MKFAEAESLLKTAIEQHAFPGAGGVVADPEGVLGSAHAGSFTYNANAPAVTRETVFDVASITKVMATTAACMMLFDHGQIHLDAPVTSVLPELAKSEDLRKKQITFRQLLAHSSGLPAYEKLFLRGSGRQQMLEAAHAVPLKASPGERAEYSDIGFILLGEALERIAGEPLNTFCAREIFRPLGLRHTRFNPPVQWQPRIPPTASHDHLRNHLVQGEVHDENCAAMGGVAGHAGLFATAEDVARFAQCILREGEGLFRPETIRLFTTRDASVPGSSRALGWDTPSQPSSSGRYFSPWSFGHLGYTGTSLWMDGERKLAVVLLTNRVWPDSKNEQIQKVRPRFHDAVMQAILSA